MENNINIEDLFKNTLENAEAQPPAGAWEAIQAKMGATAASTAAATTATGLTIGKIAAIVVTALGVGLGVGYMAFKGEKTPEKDKTITTQNTIEETSPEKTPENNVALPKDIEITNVSSVNKANKTISIVEVKKGRETKKIRVESPNNTSFVEQWLGPKKEKVNRDMIQRFIDELDKEEATPETVKEPVNTNNKDNNVSVSKVENDHVEAGIIPTVSNENPLQVKFSNLTEASSYEWDFGDGNTSKQSNPVHTYTEPGSYVIALKVSNKAGKVFTHKDLLEIKSKEENTTQEASYINQPNVFTPNGDGTSDELYFDSKNIETFEFIVYNSSGKPVYSSTDVNMRWNGTDKGGNTLAPGNYQYVYKAVGKDKKVHKKTSSLTINR